MPRLGYDVVGGRLVVNPEEAERVRAIFGLYAQTPSLVTVAQDLNRRGWRRKSWKTRKGRWHDGKPWDVANLRRLLIDPLYRGKMTLGTETFPAEHEAIVPDPLFRKVQAILKENRRGASERTRQPALLRGLLRCAPCDAAMVPSWTRSSGRLHRYYVCGKAQKRGWSTCPTRSVAAIAIESFLVDQIRDRFPQHAWDGLLAPEKERLIHLLIDRLDYDGRRLTVGFKSLEVAAS